MAKKPKFKPVITRVKLNPEQAVLTCTCWSGGNNWNSSSFGFDWVFSACDIRFMGGTFKPSDSGYCIDGPSSS